jgi:repressor LexA
MEVNMKRPGISETREKIMKFIREFVDDRGYSPTVRDILKGCSISSTAVVQHHLNVLEKEGFIHRDPEVFRSIQLADKINLLHIPVLGVIAAGQPIAVPSSDTWASEAIDTLDIPSDFVKDENVFALKVKGKSMIDALIDDGDIVLMEPTRQVVNGEMAAVWLKDKEEVTLKKFYAENNKVRLQPANTQMEPIFLEPANVEIQGRVVGVIRKLQ